MVPRLVADWREFTSLSAAESASFSPPFQPDVVEAITPAAAVAARRTPQSTARRPIAAALADVRAWLDAVGTSGPVSA